MRYIFLSVLLLFLYSCSGYSDEDLEAFDQQIIHYLDSMNIEMDKDIEGMYYTIIKGGEGDELIGYKDQVTFTYKASYLNGDVFQYIDKDNPLTYQVSQLIYGWQNALMMLKEGGEISIIIPPQLGYGQKSTDLIPPNSILKYELTVLKVE
ncbi:MAG: FKBP-type peptidyl-prolyl cis-trans isomerase [Brumimicrobium sp.]